MWTVYKILRIWEVWDTLIVRNFIMIYIISGSPRGGKTTLAKKLSLRLSIPYFSTDYLRLMLIPYSSPWVERDTHFPFEKMCDASGIASLYRDYSGHDLLDADIVESDFLWTGIDTFISFLLQTWQDYILEWSHFLPRLVSKYKDEASVRIVYLTKTDEEKIFDGLVNNRGNNDWIADNIHDDSTLRLAASWLAEYGKYFEVESAKYWLTSISTENDFSETLERVLDMLIE